MLQPHKKENPTVSMPRLLVINCSAPPICISSS